MADGCTDCQACCHHCCGNVGFVFVIERTEAGQGKAKGSGQNMHAYEFKRCVQVIVVMLYDGHVRYGKLVNQLATT